MKTKLILLITFFVSLTIWAKGGIAPKQVEAKKADIKISVDGLLNESIWKGNALKTFIQRDPDEGIPSSEKTNVWVAYDDEFIYVAANLYDSNPSKIDQSMARRDSYLDTDWFFFYVDPYLDKTTGYFFGVNPGGTLIDGTMFNDGWDDSRWDGIWYAETSVNADGWTVEIKIPFAQLRFNEKDEMKWGVNFSRTIKRRNEKSYFVMVPKQESGFVSHFAELSGLKNIHVKQRIEILPYIVQKAQYLKTPAGDPFAKGNQYKTTFGADLKFGIGSNFNIDASINPDFGQVEVDPAVVNLSAFETYFPEKRPFFIEGRDILRFGYGGANNNWGFNFGIPQLFYSRRVGRSPQGYTSGGDYIDRPKETRILGAAKLTGKIDESWSIGALSAITERTFANIDNGGIRTEEEIEPLSHYGVFRTQKEFNNGRQAIGMILTGLNRNLTDENLSGLLTNNAYTFGLDGWTFLDEDEMYVINASFVGSYVNGSSESITRLQKKPYRYFQRPDATYSKLDTNLTSMAGAYGRVTLNKQKGNWYINSALGFVTPRFEYNDMGLQYWADKFTGHIVTGYRWYEPDGIFRKKWMYVSHSRDYDFEGNKLRDSYMSFGNFQFMNYYGLNYTLFYGLESLSKSLTRGGVMAVNPAGYMVDLRVNSDSRKDVIVNLSTDYWKDQTDSYGMGASLDFEIKPSPQINISFGPAYNFRMENHQFVNNFEDGYANNTYGIRSVFGRLNQKTLSANIRVNWTFTPEISLQMFLQPLFSVGKYDNFNELAMPRKGDYNFYGENGSSVTYNATNDEYEINPEGNGDNDKFMLYNPNFNIKSFRANMVLRWEALPGSIFYLVWTHDRQNYERPGEFNFKEDFTSIITEEPDNIFLLKFSYWFDI